MTLTNLFRSKIPWYLALLLPAMSLGQVELSDDRFDELVQTWEEPLSTIEEYLKTPEIAGQNIETLREQALWIRKWAARVREDAEQEHARLARLLRALGPAPEDVAEDPSIAEQREQLTASSKRAEVRIRTTNVIVTRADSLMAQMTRAEFSLIAHVLEQRTDSPLKPSVIVNGLRLLPQRLSTLGEATSAWWRDTDFADHWLSSASQIVALIALILVVYLPLRAWLLRRCGASPSVSKPSLARRLTAILTETVANVVIPFVLVLGVYIAIVQSAGFTPELQRILDALAFSVLQFLVVVGVSRAALSPTLSAWRISHFTDQAARNLHQAIHLWAGTALVINVAMVLLNPEADSSVTTRILRIDASANDLTAVTSMIAMTIMAIAAWNVLRGCNWRFTLADDRESGLQDVPAGKPLRWLFLFARIALISALALGVMGYVNLGIYITGRIIFSLLVIGLAFLVRSLIAEILDQMASPETRIGSMIQSRFALSMATTQRLSFWLMLLTDITVIVIALAVLLLTWGVTGADLAAILLDLAQGMAIGNLRLSLTDVGVAIGVFLLLLVLVRIVQHFLANRVLHETVVDVGVRDALTAVFGYAGVVVALLVSVSLLGLELSQLAIIFGALSVGIGFGLQNLVNNFVSGLILLMQRPIKAGDWIVIGQQEGYVKKVNVTSTEIVTFDNASLIVPNSQLVTTEVLNWMHKSKLGRVVLPVGVSYESDPDQVRSLLMRCAEENERVMRRPAPIVVFQDFGDSALLFDLRFYLRDIDTRLTVGSEMRFAIKKAFDEAGIEIPFPQRDIHMRSAWETPPTEPPAAKKKERSRAEYRPWFGSYRNLYPRE